MCQRSLALAVGPIFWVSVDVSWATRTARARWSSRSSSDENRSSRESELVATSHSISRAPVCSVHALDPATASTTPVVESFLGTLRLELLDRHHWADLVVGE